MDHFRNHVSEVCQIYLCVMYVFFFGVHVAPATALSRSRFWTIIYPQYYCLRKKLQVRNEKRLDPRVLEVVGATCESVL